VPGPINAAAITDQKRIFKRRFIPESYNQSLGLTPQFENLPPLRGWSIFGTL
jgi:hypothetical protein